jgi:hypothetical protein
MRGTCCHPCNGRGCPCRHPQSILHKESCRYKTWGRFRCFAQGNNNQLLVGGSFGTEVVIQPFRTYIGFSTRFSVQPRMVKRSEATIHGGFGSFCHHSWCLLTRRFENRCWQGVYIERGDSVRQNNGVLEGEKSAMVAYLLVSSDFLKLGPVWVVSEAIKPCGNM